MTKENGNGMMALQLYTTVQLKEKLEKTFGPGKISANVERILRLHLENPAEEKKLRLRELQKEIRRFNADFMCGGELIFPEKEEGPAPQEEKEG